DRLLAQGKSGDGPRVSASQRVEIALLVRSDPGNRPAVRGQGESPRVNAFRRNGLRRPAHKILDIETSAAAGLRAGEKDSAAIGEPTGSIVMDRIMSDLLCLPRAGGQEHKLCGGSQRR